MATPYSGFDDRDDWYAAEAARRAEIEPQAIAAFTQERLQTYFLERPDVALPAVRSLEEARQVLAASPSAGVALAFAAIEYTLKKAIVRPLLLGFVHDESAGSAIEAMIFNVRAFSEFRRFLLNALRARGVDLETHTRPGSSKPVWEEAAALQRLRNEVVHDCREATAAEAEEAMAVADVFMRFVMPTVAKSLQLHVHTDWVICDRRQCFKDRIEPTL